MYKYNKPLICVLSYHLTSFDEKEYNNPRLVKLAIFKKHDCQKF